MKKYIVSFLLCLIIIEIIVSVFTIKISYADSYRYEYTGNISYTGFKEKLDIIKLNHPNWNITIMKTGLDWNQTIAAEYTGHHTSPKNLIQGKTGGWICSICGEQIYDVGNWMCASEATIKYYMDSRNWIVDSPYLFQFLQLDYIETTDDEVYASLNGTFLYTMENASLINRVCKEKNANVYFIIARILQEQGNGGGITYKMVDTDGAIYYNIFNIGASGNGDEVYVNALNKAKNNGWTTLEKCISDGISFILSDYISYKQNTLYLNKFDVETYNGTYVKQYMQNIEAPKTESISMYNRMKNANLLNKNLNFIIPVYENMPDMACHSPDDIGELYPKNIRVKEGHSGIMVRAAKSTTASILYRIPDSSTIILSVERFSDGWHKVVLLDGTTGYLKFDTNYMEEIDDIVNCQEQMTINNDYTILRVGPGISQTEITTLPRGQTITRIDNTGRYTFEGKTWDRVMISDGRQGFVARDNLDAIQLINNQTNSLNELNNTQIGQENTTNENINSENILTENNIVNNINEENIINMPQTNDITIPQNQINQTNTSMEENQIIEKNTITLENQITNQNTNTIENQVINDNINNQSNQNTTSQNEISQSIEENKNKYLIISPNELAKDLGGIVTKNGVETQEVGTGYNVNINGENFTIIKRGDVNGDAYIKANDYLIIKDYIMGKLTNNLSEPYIIAADVTNDNSIKANDYLKIKDHIMYGVEIQ